MRSKGDLIAHKLFFHEVKRPFKCCNNRFNDKFDLKLHLESVHKGKKPFKGNISSNTDSDKIFFTVLPYWAELDEKLSSFA